MLTYQYKDRVFDSLQAIRNETGIVFSDTDESLALMEIKVIEEPDPVDERSADPVREAKRKRAAAVRNIKVTVDGMTFDGDEGSQTRMARAIAVAKDGEKTAWVLADNTIAEVTKEQLQQALRLAGQEQTKLWVLPYKN